MRLADSHCHITDPRLIDRADEIVGRMDADGLDFIVEVSASVTESRDVIEFAKNHANVYCTVGVHPHMIGEYTDEFEMWAIDAVPPFIRAKKVVAFGEIGLDYFHNDHPHELQRDIFTRQIRLADRLGLPLVVHTRDAFKDTMDVLIENKKFIRNGILFHCFSESGDEVAVAREHFDAYFAFGGGVTYAEKSLSAIRAVPIDRMLLETDAPYLNPKTAGGKKIINEPKNVSYVAEFIAGVLDVPKEDIATATLENTRRFFGL